MLLSTHILRSFLTCKFIKGIIQPAQKNSPIAKTPQKKKKPSNSFG